MPRSVCGRRKSGPKMPPRRVWAGRACARPLSRAGFRFAAPPEPCQTPALPVPRRSMQLRHVTPGFSLGASSTTTSWHTAVQGCCRALSFAKVADGRSTLPRRWSRDELMQLRPVSGAPSASHRRLSGGRGRYACRSAARAPGRRNTRALQVSREEEKMQLRHVTPGSSTSLGASSTLHSRHMEDFECNDGQDAPQAWSLCCCGGCARSVRVSGAELAASALGR
jgi:hypothetical protein